MTQGEDHPMMGNGSDVDFPMMGTKPADPDGSLLDREEAARQMELDLQGAEGDLVRSMEAEPAPGRHEYTAELFFARRPDDYRRIVILSGLGIGALRLAAVYRCAPSTVLRIRSRERVRVEIERKRLASLMRGTAGLLVEEILRRTEDPKALAKETLRDLGIVAGILVQRSNESDGEGDGAGGDEERGGLGRRAPTAREIGAAIADLRQAYAERIGMGSSPSSAAGQKEDGAAEPAPAIEPAPAEDRPRGSGSLDSASNVVKVEHEGKGGNGEGDTTCDATNETDEGRPAPRAPGPALA